MTTLVAESSSHRACRRAPLPALAQRNRASSSEYWVVGQVDIPPWFRLGCDLRQPCHPGRMAPHFPIGTTYRVVLRRDRTYGVEVSKPKAMPFIVTGFRSEAEANGWIKIQSLRTKEAEPR